MKMFEIAAFYRDEMAKHGKFLSELPTERRREFSFQWDPSPDQLEGTTMIPRAIMYFRRGSIGCRVDLYFLIQNTEIMDDAGRRTVELFINVANWPTLWDHFTGEPEYLVKAAADHNERLDNLLVAVNEIRQHQPLTDEVEIMGEKLWAWKPFRMKGT